MMAYAQKPYDSTLAEPQRSFLSRRARPILLAAAASIVGLSSVAVNADVIGVSQSVTADTELDATATAEFVQQLTDEAENVLDDYYDLEGVQKRKTDLLTAFNQAGPYEGQSAKRIARAFVRASRASLDNQGAKRDINRVAKTLIGDTGGNPDAEISDGGAQTPAPTVIAAAPTPTPTPTPAPAPVVATPPPPPPPSVVVDNGPALKTYIRSLNYDPRVLLAERKPGGTVINLGETPLPQTRAPGSGKVVVCTPVKVGESSELNEITIFQPSEGVIYPGALIYGDATLRDGLPRKLTELPRRPITARVDLPGLGSEGTMVLENPTSSAYNGRLNEVLEGWSAGAARDGYVNAGRSTYNYKTLYSREQIGAALKIDAKWASGSAGLDAAFASDSEKNVVIAAFRQVFYTVNAEPPSSPELAFASSVTDAAAKSVFDAARPPAYVSSVNYGRVILIRMETSKDIKTVDVEAAFKYGADKAAGISVQANANYDSILRNSDMRAFTIGGNAANSVEAVSSPSPDALRAIITGNNAVYSRSNPGVPIAYTVKYLKDDALARMSSTTEYTREDCQNLDNFPVTVIHSGAYVADIALSWSGPEPGDHKLNGKTAGFRQSFSIPGDSTQIKIHAKNYTGLVWQPNNDVINRELTPAELKDGLCITLGGTTLGPSNSAKPCNL